MSSACSQRQCGERPAAGLFGAGMTTPAFAPYCVRARLLERGGLVSVARGKAGSFGRNDKGLEDGISGPVEEISR